MVPGHTQRRAEMGSPIVGSYGLIGTLETIRQRLAAYEVAGVQELVIHFSDFSDATHLDAVRLFAKTFIA